MSAGEPSLDRPTPGDAPTPNERFLSERIERLERRATDKKAGVMSQTEEQKEAEIERRAQERVTQLLDVNSTMPDMIAASVEQGFRRVVSDPHLRAQFWADGYAELEKHAGTKAAQWLGRRIVNIIINAAVAGLLAWVVMTGRLK